MTTLKLAAAGRWSPEQAWQWHQENGWQVGFNYLPRTAVNFMDMWMAQSFEPPLIREELSWARDAGFNALRTNLPFTLWQHDPESLKSRLHEFLAITNDLGFKVMLCPLDDCEFSGRPAVFGPQPEPVTGLHNSQAIGSPGRDVVVDPEQWPAVVAYVEDLLTTFGQDNRVHCWDLYNEPGNQAVFSLIKEETESHPELRSRAQELLLEVFAAARRCSPLQPLTTGAWRLNQDMGATVSFDDPLDKLALALSDVISFHAYCPKVVMERTIDELASVYDRPLYCTEWMGRHAGSWFNEQLPVLKSKGVGAFQWGLVAGATQTYLPWPHLADSLEADKYWFHDFFHADGTVYSAEEAALLKQQLSLTSK